jgi:hypothetical protein
MVLAVVLFLIVAVLAIALWWRYTTRRQKPQVASTLKGGEHSRYHCVEIRYRSGACDAVRRLQGLRFLSDEAPPLPVKGCDAPSCSCRYAHYEDRRQEDRRNPFGQAASVPPPSVGGERRSKADRRKSWQRPFRPSVQV